MILPGVTQMLRLAETDSTQTVAKFLAEQGAEEGTLVWADRQSSGRGRLERQWQSKPGGLYCSLILRPDFAPSRLAAVSLATAEAVARALSRRPGVETAVKPPNDVYALGKSGKGLKICGILCEAAGGERTVDWLVVGIGVNVNNPVNLSTATSLKAATGRPWSVEKVLAAVLAEFWSRYERL